MVYNYLTVALRKLSKYRDYALLNIAGLALSVACSVIIFALIRHHTRFDVYHKNADRTARIVMDVKTETLMPFSGAPAPMSKTLREECAWLEKTAIRSDVGSVLVSVARADGGNNKYKEDETFAWVEPEYMEILDLPLLHGAARGLAEPNTVVLSEKKALKYFGESDVTGRTLRIDNEVDLRVVGVMRDLPPNTDYKHDILGSWATFKSLPGKAESANEWSGARGGDYCFALLQAGRSIEELQAFMLQMNEKYPHSGIKDLFHYKAKPLTAMHFDPDYGFGINKNLIWALGLIGLFLLLTACVNFVNMATAQALTRAREVGVRKSLGSTQKQLFGQFMIETGLIVAASIAIGLVLARFGLPYMNAWTKESLRFDRSLAQALAVFLPLLGIALTFLAGFYPGWMQARFQTVESLKGVGDATGKGGFSLRRLLVTTQFAISQALIIGAAVITAQMRFAQNVDWGFRPGAVVTLQIPEKDKMKTLQQQITQISGVKSASLCYRPPATGSNSQTPIIYDNRPEPEPWLANNKPADDRYLETFNLQLVAGRNIQPGDTVREILVNETFVKKLNLASPADVLDKTVQIGTSKGTITGVLRDFHHWSLEEPIAPIIISTYSPDYATCAVQLAPGNPAPALAKVRNAWEGLFPNHYYEQRFMDEQLGEFLETETTMLRLVQTFSGIAILIGCMGLYGLAAFMINRKRKEIGVRKVLGADLSGILWLFGKEYVRLILIAFALAAPLAWQAMNSWLEDYAYRANIGIGIFALSLSLSFFVAILTVGFQSARAALANPVQSLRNE